jgi:hypothetical protein
LTLKTPPHEQHSFLSNALVQLRRTMQWCASRQVMIDLASGKYKSSVSVVPVECFLEEVARSNSTGVVFKVLDSTKETTKGGAFNVAFDEKMARLALENGVTNALSHGDRKIVILEACMSLDKTQGAFLIDQYVVRESLVIHESCAPSLKRRRQDTKRNNIHTEK